MKKNYYLRNNVKKWFCKYNVIGTLLLLFFTNILIGQTIQPTFNKGQVATSANLPELKRSNLEGYEAQVSNFAVYRNVATLNGNSIDAVVTLGAML